MATIQFRTVVAISVYYCLSSQVTVKANEVMATAVPSTSQPSTSPPRDTQPTPGAVVNGIQLEVELPPTVTCGQELTVNISAINKGTNLVRLFRPRHFDEDCVSQLRFVRSDGKVFTPRQLPYQSFAKPGIMGDILEITSEKKAPLAKVRLTLVRAGDHTPPTPQPIPPGQ